MSEMNRREALTLIALAPFAPAVGGVAPAAAQATPVGPTQADTGAAQAPRFFTAAEMVTIGVLADMIIPADARDSSLPVRIRGGIAGIDAESRRRFEHGFVDATAAEREQILDDIAWPERARPEMSHGVAFFNRFRDLVASGFWSSEMGVRDLQYMGNTARGRWDGFPPEAERKLGIAPSA